MDDEVSSWTTKQTFHEGLPLFIRYPENINDGTAVFPVLGVITHHLSKVRASGLPEPDYNETLLPFDRALRKLFEEERHGQTVLIETFAGKRNYYVYVLSENCVLEKVSVLQQQFPQLKLSWKAYPDKKWGFIKDYMKAVIRPASES